MEVAHIQSYRSEKSNNTRNGLLLRVDIHRLFDNDLIYIDDTYVVHISNHIVNEYYKKFDGLKIILPISEFDHPSICALKLRKQNFRE